MQNHMPKQYLWAVGEGIETIPAGTLIAERYLLQSHGIVVDTRPDQFPDVPAEISDHIAPYLRLFPYRLHLPLVYGFVPTAKTKRGKEIWLLEQGPIDPLQATLRPRLIDLWPDASPLRQLNWLWQMARLWYPFKCQAVVSSLLNPELLRVEGSLVRLLQLQSDSQKFKLSYLGQLWQEWIPTAHPKIQRFLTELTQQIIAQELRTSNQLIDQLDQALEICGCALTGRVEIITGTDTGPTRTQNEDACYPNTQTAVQASPNADSLAIVCDGIGGQDAGEVASQLAIDVLRQSLQSVPFSAPHQNTQSRISQLKRATNQANDAICQRNDRENRHGRERMGTTLVMALAHAHEIYIAHVGDSRAYWISQTGCYQVTLDDDVASREVRLGYALYRDAIQPRSAGALIQALGITNSTHLYPTVQRFLLDEEGLFLLCSDGLSDQDQVEKYWRTEVLPILNRKTDLSTTRNRLIEIGNTQNGHDNVTVALVHVQLSSNLENIPEIQVPLRVQSADNLSEEDSDFGESEDSDFQNTLLIQKSSSQVRKIWSLSLGIAFLLGLGGFLLYLFGVFSTTPPEPQPEKQNQPIFKPPIQTEPMTPAPEVQINLKSLIILNPSENNDSLKPKQSIQLLKEFGKPWIKGIVPSQTIFQVIEKQSTPQTGTWLELKICSLASSPDSPAKIFTENEAVLDENQEIETSEDWLERETELEELEETEPSAEVELIPTLKPGSTGWIRAKDAASMMVESPALFKPKQRGSCQTVE